MTLAAVTAARTDQAARLLLEGRSASAVVGQIADDHQLSRRQAQRIVNGAYQLLVNDLDQVGLERPQLVAQLVTNLQAAMTQALATNQPGAAVACARELRELLRLSEPPNPNLRR